MVATLEDLVRDHQAMVLRVTERITRDPHEAEDYAQETWLRVSRHMHRFRGENGCTLKSWIYGVARNTAFMLRKSKRYRDRRVECPLDAGFVVSGRDDGAISSFGGGGALSAEARSAFALAHSERSVADLLVDDDTPEALLEAVQSGIALSAQVQALPEYQRTPWMLAEIHEMSYEDIALRLGIPVGTVRSRVHRARNALDPGRTKQRQMKAPRA